MIDFCERLSDLPLEAIWLNVWLLFSRAKTENDVLYCRRWIGMLQGPQHYKFQKSNLVWWESRVQVIDGV